MSDDDYCEGLLTAQRMANEASHTAHMDGRIEASNALAELSTDLLLARERVSARQSPQEAPAGAGTPGKAPEASEPDDEEPSHGYWEAGDHG